MNEKERNEIDDILVYAVALLMNHGASSYSCVASCDDPDAYYLISIAKYPKYVGSIILPPKKPLTKEKKMAKKPQPKPPIK